MSTILDVDMNNMLAEFNSMRMQAGGVHKAHTPESMISNEIDNTKGADFAVILKNALNGVNEMQVTANDLKTNFDLGDRSMSLAEVMIAGQKAGIALEATIQVRNKMVEAYKTIMQMQI
ncbi:MAG: flagellar hook-basal body complex protein FliE [Succinivibrionaceae bacterium]